MSHFTVLVIGDDTEELLAPFQENNNGDCPQEYMKFEDQEEEFKNEWETGTRDEFHCSSSCSWGQAVSKKNFGIISKLKVGESVELSIEDKMGMGYFKNKNYYHCHEQSEKHEAPTEHIWVKVTKIIKSEHPDPEVCFKGEVKVERVNPPKSIPHKEFYKTFKQFIKDWHGHDAPDEETGKYGYWFNPNAKWDWFQVGGRWAGFFKLKKGKEGMLGEKSWANENEEIPEGRADQAKKGDIDFEGMLADNFEKYSKLYDKFEVAMKDDPDKAKINAYWQYSVANTSGNKDKFVPQTREQYLKAHCFPSTFAVLKDGKWYEKGTMHWWAIVSDEKEESKWDKEFLDLLEGLPENTILSVCDCHI